MPRTPPKPYLRRGEGIARFGHIKYPVLCKTSDSTSSKDSGHGSDSVITMASNDSSSKGDSEVKLSKSNNGTASATSNSFVSGRSSKSRERSSASDSSGSAAIQKSQGSSSSSSTTGTSTETSASSKSDHAIAKEQSRRSSLKIGINGGGANGGALKNQSPNLEVLSETELSLLAQKQYEELEQLLQEHSSIDTGNSIIERLWTDAYASGENSFNRPETTNVFHDPSTSGALLDTVRKRLIESFNNMLLDYPGSEIESLRRLPSLNVADLAANPVPGTQSSRRLASLNVADLAARDHSTSDEISTSSLSLSSSLTTPRLVDIDDDGRVKDLNGLKNAKNVQDRKDLQDEQMTQEFELEKREISEKNSKSVKKNGEKRKENEKETTNGSVGSPSWASPRISEREKSPPPMEISKKMSTNGNFSSSAEAIKKFSAQTNENVSNRFSMNSNESIDHHRRNFSISSLTRNQNENFFDDFQMKNQSNDEIRANRSENVAESTIFESFPSKFSVPNMVMPAVRKKNGEKNENGRKISLPISQIEEIERISNELHNEISFLERCRFKYQEMLRAAEFQKFELDRQKKEFETLRDKENNRMRIDRIRVEKAENAAKKILKRESEEKKELQKQLLELQHDVSEREARWADERSKRRIETEKLRLQVEALKSEIEKLKFRLETTQKQSDKYEAEIQQLRIRLRNVTRDRQRSLSPTPIQNHSNIQNHNRKQVRFDLNEEKIKQQVAPVNMTEDKHRRQAAPVNMIEEKNRRKAAPVNLKTPQKQLSRTVSVPEIQNLSWSESPGSANAYSGSQESIVKQLERHLPDGSRETIYSNKTVERISGDGSLRTLWYSNGDVKKVYVDGTEVYTYAANDVIEITQSDGTTIFKFPNGTERREFANGVVETKTATEMIRVVPNGEEIVESLIDGNKLHKRSDGTEFLFLIDGSKEIRTPEFCRREFRNGDVKMKFSADQREETHYSNGRVVVKDKSGKILRDHFDSKFQNRSNFDSRILDY